MKSYAILLGFTLFHYILFCGKLVLLYLSVRALFRGWRYHSQNEYPEVFSSEPKTFLSSRLNRPFGNSVCLGVFFSFNSFTFTGKFCHQPVRINFNHRHWTLSCGGPRSFECYQSLWQEKVRTLARLEMIIKLNIGTAES
jgi:hypothetical protein